MTNDVTTPPLVISASELGVHSGAILKLVIEGQEVTVERYGTQIVKIVPVQSVIPLEKEDE